MNTRKQIVFVSLAICTLLTTNAILLYQNLQLKNQLTSLNSPVATPTPRYNPSLAWKTYTGTVFTYQYPGDLYYVDSDTTNSIKLYLSQTSQNWPLIDISIKHTDIVDNSKFVSALVNPTPLVTTAGLNLMKESEAIGAMGLSVVQVAELQEGSRYTTIQILTAPEGSPYFNGNEWQIINQILDSFQFTTDNITYTNNQLGASLKYPPNWYITENAPSKSFSLNNYDTATMPGRGYSPEEDKGKFSFTFYAWDKPIYPKTITELKQIIADNNECTYVGDPAGDRISLNEQEKNIGNLLVFSRDTRCSESPDINLQHEIFVLDGQGKIIKMYLGLDQASGQLFLPQILSNFSFVN